jgi:hypothetical protein
VVPFVAVPHVLGFYVVDREDNKGEEWLTVAMTKEREELEARIERLQQLAASMEDREAAARLIVHILALEMELLNNE